MEGSIGKIQQVIMNLLSNAKDALEGLENKEIKISAELKNNMALIDLLNINKNYSVKHEAISI